MVVRQFFPSRSIAALLAGASAWWPAQAVANCARPSGYDVTVTGNTVTICALNFQNRSCPDPDGLLRENTTSGKVVKVAEHCSTVSSGCYLDECVPKGSYRYGFAKPYDCCAACCGTDYFELADVTTDAPSGCSPSDGGAATPFTGSLPWKTDQTLCNYQGGTEAGAAGTGSGSGGAGGAASGTGGLAGASAGGTAGASGSISVAGGGSAGSSGGAAGASTEPDGGTAAPAKSGDDGGCGCVVGARAASRTVFVIDGLLGAVGFVLLARKRQKAG